MSTVPHTDPRIHRLAPGVPLPEMFAPGDRIHIATGHSPSASTIERLRLVHAQLVKTHGHGLIDPTGLLGVETSTTQTRDTIAARTYTDSIAVGANMPGTYQKRDKLPRKPQPTRYRGLS